MDQLIAKLAASGSHVTSALSVGGDQAVALEDQVGLAAEVLSELRSWLGDAPESGIEGEAKHQGWEYLRRSGSYLVEQSARSFEGAAKTRSGGFGLFGRGPNRWLALAETLRLEVSAASVLAVLRAYLGATPEATQWVSFSPMYEVLTSELATVYGQLDSMATHPTTSQARVVEPFFQGLTESLQTLRSVLDERISDSGQVSSTELQMGARYLLACATYAWQEGVDSLGIVRQLYMDVRDRWASNSEIIVERVSVTLLHCVTGQAIVTGTDGFLRSQDSQAFSNGEPASPLTP
jgi:hypothetical protein